MNRKVPKRLISIIIPAKNRIQYTRVAIKSALSQKLPHGFKLEIIVVDNKSYPRLRPYLVDMAKDIILERNNQSDNPSSSRNIGLKKAKGKYILFLDNDDFLKPNFFLELIPHFNSKHVIGVVCLPTIVFQNGLDLVRTTKIIFLNIFKEFIFICCYLFNKGRLPRPLFFLMQVSHSIFRSDNSVKFDKDRYIAEDWDYFIKKMRLGEIQIVPKKLMVYRYHKGNLSFSKKFKFLKRQSYSSLISKLDPKYQKSIWVRLFRIYYTKFLLT